MTPEEMDALRAQAEKASGRARLQQEAEEFGFAHVSKAELIALLDAAKAPDLHRAMLAARTKDWESAMAERDRLLSEIERKDAALRAAEASLVSDRTCLIECDTLLDADGNPDMATMDGMTVDAVREVDVILTLIRAALASVSP